MPWEHARYCGLGMDAIVIVCSRNTNIIMVWAWMLWLSFALGTRALPWFGHGCAIVCSRNTNVIMVGNGCAIVCSRNTSVTMVWAWMHLLSYALRTRTLLWFGHGCFGIRVRSKNAMRGIRSISGPRNTSNVSFVSRRPHPERSARCAFFARLRSGGANINK